MSDPPQHQGGDATLLAPPSSAGGVRMTAAQRKKAWWAAKKQQEQAQREQVQRWLDQHQTSDIVHNMRNTTTPGTVAHAVAPTVGVAPVPTSSASPHQTSLPPTRSQPASSHPHPTHHDHTKKKHATPAHAQTTHNHAPAILSTPSPVVPLAARPPSASASSPAASPTMTAAKPTATPLDGDAKKAQAATLFSLMSSFQKTHTPATAPSAHPAGSSSLARPTSTAGKKGARANKQGHSAPGHTGPTANSVAQIDLSKLISRSHEEQIKVQQQQQQRQRQQTHEDAKTHPQHAAEDASALSRLDAMVETSPSITPMPSIPPPLSPVVTASQSPSDQFRSLYARAKADEVQLHTLLHGVGASNKPSTSTAILSPDSRSQVIHLRAKLRVDYLHLLTAFSAKFSVQKNIVHRLWMHVYREMEPILNQAKQHEAAHPPGVAADGGFDLFAASAAEEAQTMRDRLRAAIEANFDIFDRLSDDINNKYAVFGAPPPMSGASSESHSAESVHAARLLLSSLCVCLGDLERYRQLHLCEEPDWSRCRFFYTRSLLIAPSSAVAGKSHNQLAKLAAQTTRTDDGHQATAMLDALYHYTRAMTASPTPYNARTNVLGLYEENRLLADALLRKVGGSPQTPLPASNLSILLCLFTRLIGMLDTHTGVESFERVRRAALGDKLRAVLNEDWFVAVARGTPTAAGGEHRVLTDQLALKMVLLIMHLVERLIMRDAASAARASHVPALSLPSVTAVTPTTPFPFPLAHDTQQALSILYDLLGILLRIPVLISKGSEAATYFSSARLPLPFLPALTLALGWIRAKWPWLLTQSELLADEIGGAVHPCEYVRSGLAQLANMLVTILEPEAAGAAAAIPTSPASMRDIEGFTPLLGCDFWPSAQTPRSELDSFEFQSRALIDFSWQILYAHPVTGRLSALPPPPSALSRAEIDQLREQHALWLQQQDDDRAGKPTPPPKKRLSKQAKPRPAVSESARAAAATDASSSSCEEVVTDHETASSSQSDAEEQVIARMKELSHSKPEVAANLPAPISALEAMVSDANLGLLVPQTTHTAPVRPTTSSPGLHAGLASPLSLSSPKPLLILDAPNLAMSHGKHQSFSVRGIELVMDFFHRRGFRVLAFVPESYLDYEAVGRKRRALKAGFDVKASSVPDNIGLLHAWRAEGVLVTTPAGDYDDTYAVQYAMTHANALIVSNDRYRDHAYFHAASAADRAHILRWLKEHVISYTFIGDEWHQNPDWKFDERVGLRKISKTRGPNSLPAGGTGTIARQHTR